MKTIKSIGVVGAGTMGSALAQKFAQEGFKVILVDREMSYVEKGLSGVENTLREGIERRLFTEEQVGNILANIKGTDQLRDLQVCDLVVEAIYEDLDAKSDLFKQLSVILPKETVVATNTSSFSVTFRFPSGKIYRSALFLSCRQKPFGRNYSGRENFTGNLAQRRNFFLFKR
jgi:3-hydroxyacyl-CoA dehydrogenase